MKTRILLCCLGWFALLGCKVAPEARVAAEGDGGTPLSAPSTAEGKVVEVTFLSELAGLATPEWGEEERRVVGNLHALAAAFKLAGKWTPSPSSLAAFERTPLYLAVNLWDPYARGPGTLLLGTPEEWAGMAPGTYASWEEAGHRFFAGAIRSGPVIVRARLYPDGWGDRDSEGYESPDPKDWAQGLAFCRLLSDILLVTTPRLTHADFGPARTLVELKTYWWRWDARAMLENSPFGAEDLSLHWLGGDRWGAVDCRLPSGESVWAHSPLSSERTIHGGMATLPPLDWVLPP
ncbi:hypothetical protein IIA16_00635 [bacterium]|nr:hypothetical protein [bacterium]